MGSMTIGKLSGATGVKVTTIRYYESIDLLDEPERSASGQRLYGAAAVERLGFIRHARDLGFPVSAIRELISLQVDPGRDCDLVDQIARRQLGEVRRRLTQLEALEAELKRMITACEGGKVASCSVLAALGHHEHCLHEEHAGKEVLAALPSK
ncbi:MAG: MerR family transcriptional regulator [Henriciella sp.]|jgi:DNA-binding transcriptional MerR regulator|uniref:MerR family transcriptional regulator n=1 Tax=Henriciella sp. TaxID=1968823 RepID=UPI000C10D642|nr:helix-turn-helix domain-containing protein [Henriciella sp.]MBF33207.1 MerR family transcriptional regulator [Hyphomonadaceae bacterium]MBK75872.1 MerR family transcriptional regulator [Henriciella sp.]PHR80210.1 MAG: MerR family transcriptional regulator [Henriciella sp.]|tara:strand:- start:993 stop:1451 length:459 start_codon:yes stop_codon:yes gene_type:complete